MAIAISPSAAASLTSGFSYPAQSVFHFLDLTRLLSCGNRAAHRAAVQHQLVAAHVDNGLSVIGSALLVELRRNHDTKTRGLALVHGNKKEIPVSVTEQGHFGRIVKIDLRQVSQLCRNVERQTSGLQKGARDRLVS